MGEGISSQADTPEGLFLAWLVAQPEGADIPSAARVEIARVERTEIAADQQARLIGLLTQAMITPQRPSRSGRRQRH